MQRGVRPILRKSKKLSECPQKLDLAGKDIKAVTFKELKEIVFKESRESRTEY